MPVSNPHLGTPTEGGWAMGFSFGFMSENVSDSPPLVIAPEQFDAFNEGTLVGQQTAIDGLDAAPSCTSLSQTVSEPAEHFVTGVHALELLDIAKHVRHLGKAGAGALVFLLTLAIPGPPLLSPETAFPSLAVQIREQLDSLGINQGAVFFAMGIDEETAGCELQISPLFKSLDQARDAATGMGRPKWLIARWSLAMSSSFDIVETSAS